MEKISISVFYLLGIHLNWINQLKEGDKYPDYFDHFESSIEYLIEIDNILKLYFKISLPTLSALKATLEVYRDEAGGPYSLNYPDDILSFDIESLLEIKGVYNEFERVFLAELDSLHTYILADPGVYSIDSLLSEDRIFTGKKGRRSHKRA